MCIRDRPYGPMELRRCDKPTRMKVAQRYRFSATSLSTFTILRLQSDTSHQPESTTQKEQNPVNFNINTVHNTKPQKLVNIGWSQYNNGLVERRLRRIWPQNNVHQ